MGPGVSGSPGPLVTSLRAAAIAGTARARGRSAAVDAGRGDGRPAHRSGALPRLRAVLITVLLIAVAPALAILGFGIVARAVAAQRVTARVVQYAPERGSTVLRDALLVDADRLAVAAALIDLAVKRKLRLVAQGGRRSTIGAELAPGATLTDEELSVLEVLFGPEHTSSRLRRFSSDRRALQGRVRTLLQGVEHALAREGLVARDRVTWPGTTLTVLAYLGMLVEGVLIVVTLVATDWVALAAALVALATTIATIFVTPASWRRFLPPAVPRREHLAGLRRYLELAEVDRLRVLQSPAGAELRAVEGSAHAHVPASASAAASARKSAPSDAAGPAVATSAADAAGPADADASAPLVRFHLHERLLPYAVLFGLERQWIAQLQLDHAALETSNPHTLAGLVDVTAEVATAIDAAGGVLELAASLGDLVDGAGTVLVGIGDLFDTLNT
nr:DUF2207 domain-containing protein [Agromyces tardus]